MGWYVETIWGCDYNKFLLVGSEGTILWGVILCYSMGFGDDEDFVYSHMYRYRYVYIYIFTHISKVE